MMHTYTDKQITAFSELISLTHTEMLTTGVWRKILDLISAVVPSDFAAVMFFDHDTGAPMTGVSRNMDDSFFEWYTSNYKNLEIVMPVALAADMTVWRPEDVVDKRKWRATPAYRMLSGTHDIRNNVTLVVPHSNGLALWVRLFRTTSSSPLTDKEMEILKLIQTHIATAVRCLEELREEDTLIEAIVPSIEKSHRPCFVFNSNGTLVHVSESARRICQAADDEEAVLSTITKNVSVLLDTSPGFRAVTDEHPEWLVTIAGTTYGLVLLPLQLPGLRMMFLLFASDAGANTLAVCERSMLVLQFSAREADVARMLVKGLSNGEIAEKMQLAVVTIEEYVEKIRKKTGVSNRNQVLMKLLEV